MNKQYILVTILLLIIIFYHQKQYKKKTKKETPIDKIINIVNSFVRKAIVNPVVKPSLWTYIEPISEYKSIHLHEQNETIPSYFQLCIDIIQQTYPSLVILTPQNISDYIDDFPIRMGHDSEIPLRKRVDLLFSFILEKYGGLCISPGVVVKDISELIHQSNINDIVTMGTSPKTIGFSKSQLTPDTLVLGGKKGSPFLKLYKQIFLKTYFKNNKQISDSYDILSSLLIYKQPKQFHLTSLSDGTHDKYLRKIDMSVFLSKTPIDYGESPLYVITPTYEELFEKQYSWFLHMSKRDLVKSNITLVNYLI